MGNVFSESFICTRIQRLSKYEKEKYRSSIIRIKQVLLLAKCYNSPINSNYDKCLYLYLAMWSIITSQCPDLWDSANSLSGAKELPTLKSWLRDWTTSLVSSLHWQADITQQIEILYQLYQLKILPAKHKILNYRH